MGTLDQTSILVGVAFVGLLGFVIWAARTPTREEKRDELDAADGVIRSSANKSVRVESRAKGGKPGPVTTDKPTEFSSLSLVGGLCLMAGTVMLVNPTIADSGVANLHIMTMGGTLAIVGAIFVGADTIRAAIIKTAHDE